MKILKLFGWALLGLFVFFLIGLISVAVFDYTTDEMEIKTLERSTKPMVQECVRFFSFWLQEDAGPETLDEMLSRAVDSDLILLQNCKEAYRVKIESLIQFGNGYYSFSKRSPVSFSSDGRVSFMDFSGLYTLSAFTPLEVRKLLLPADTNWFNSLLSPMPSLQILEFQQAGKQLYIINLDNVMNDQWESQEINETRLEYIKTSVIETLPEDAHFLIAGHWRNILPGQSLAKEPLSGKAIPLDWTKTGWQWVYSPEEQKGYGVLASGSIQIKETAFIPSPSENSPKAISLLFCLE